MAILHETFSFIERDVDKILQECSSTNFDLFKNDLHNLAMNCVRKLGKPQREKLKYLRYDEEWLIKDRESYKLDKWFLLSLMYYSCPGSNLSSTHPFSYQILGNILPKIGWDTNSINSLKYGNDLNGLLSKHNTHRYAMEIEFFQYYAGWLDNNEIKLFHDKVIYDRSVFENSEEYIISCLDDDYFSKFDKRRIIQKSFDDLKDMLELPLSKGQSLLLIFG